MTSGHGVSSSQPSFPTIDGLCSPDVLVHLQPETVGILGVNGVWETTIICSDIHFECVCQNIPLTCGWEIREGHLSWLLKKKKCYMYILFAFFPHSNVKVESWEPLHCANISILGNILCKKRKVHVLNHFYKGSMNKHKVSNV